MLTEDNWEKSKNYRGWKKSKYHPISLEHAYRKDPKHKLNFHFRKRYFAPWRSGKLDVHEPKLIGFETDPYESSTTSEVGVAPVEEEEGSPEPDARQSRIASGSSQTILSSFVPRIWQHHKVSEFKS